MFNINGLGHRPFYITLTVQGEQLQMELDTGAAVSVMSEQTYKTVWNAEKAPPIEPAQVQLHVYTGDTIPVVGVAKVTVNHINQSKELPILIVKGDGPTLLGRDWLTELTLNVDWSSLHCVQVREALSKVLDKHSAVFTNELGKAKDYVAILQVDPTVEPKFYKARPVSFAMKHKVEAELDPLLATGVIEPVKYSSWAAPVVSVMKQDGSIHLCSDFKLTLNKAAKPDIYPLPHIDELFATLGGGKTFSKLDLSNAYQQLLLSEELKAYTMINTHKGLFRFTRLPFGASAAPAIFQRVMETLLKGIPNVSVYLDDILVSGNSDKAHLDNLEAVLSRLGAAGFQLKQSKCIFFLPEVEYLGHRIIADGLHPTTSKVKAIAVAPPPKNVAQLKAFWAL